MKVYLAGPITGLSYAGCTDWREYVQKELQGYGITCFCPMRGKQNLRDAEIIDDTVRNIDPMTTDQAIIGRDSWDVDNCDLLFVNLLGSDRASIGTCFEFAWAWKKHTPVITIMEDSGNIHEHPMVREATTVRVPTLNEGIRMIFHFLPEVRV